MIVADTNILAYLLIDGDRVPVCREVLRLDPKWTAPVLWRSELRNVLSLYILHEALPFSIALECMHKAEKIMGDRDYKVETEMVLNLTKCHPISTYDAEYVSLAKSLNVPLVTTDKKILREFKTIATTPEEFVH
jgi:predicted nucleic acid-binding protein